MGSHREIPLLCMLSLGCSGSPASTPPVTTIDASMDDAGFQDAADGGVLPTAEEAAAFQTLLMNAQGILDSSHTVGASIAVVLHGQLMFAAGLGKKNMTSGAPVSTQTLFRAASMSKMIVAATAMTLVAEGKLGLDQPITKYLPDFQLAPGINGSDPGAITIDLLLSHTSGFPCDTIPQCGGGDSSGSRNTFFANHPQSLWAPPGTVYDYSNTGFALAASVIEGAAASGDGSFESLAHDRVFVPSGMTTATFDAEAANSGDHATGYKLDAQGHVSDTFEPVSLDCPLLRPPGGVFATATDYAHFAEALLGGGVFSPNSISAIETGHVDVHQLPTRKYGYGLISQYSPFPHHLSIWHDGSLPGFLSLLWMIPDAEFAIAVLVNSSGGVPVPSQIVGAALRLFLPSYPQKVPEAATAPSQWAPYVGAYDDAYGTLGAGLNVAFDNGTSLTIDAPNSMPIGGRVTPVSGVMKQSQVDTWILPDTTAVTFFPNEAGVPTYLVSRRGIAIRSQ